VVYLVVYLVVYFVLCGGLICLHGSLQQLVHRSYFGCRQYFARSVLE
jgi:hypothetical protein